MGEAEVLLTSLEKIWILSPPFQSKSFYVFRATIAQLKVTVIEKELKLTENVSF